jgi:hypothetical protein
MLKSHQKRVAMEQHVVGIETGFFLSSSAKGPCFIGWHKTSGNGNWYQLQLQLTYAFPNEKPILTILSPQRLFQYNSLQALNDLGSSHNFHIDGTDENGYLKICHTRNWDASKSCVGVILKGCLWCEAYNNYMATGITIDAVLKELIENQEGCSTFFKNILNKTPQEDFGVGVSIPDSYFNNNPESVLGFSQKEQHRNLIRISLMPNNPFRRYLP